VNLGKRRLGFVLPLLAADAAVLVAAFLAAYRLRVLLNRPLEHHAAPLSYYLWLLGVIVPVWLSLLAIFGAYGIGWTARSRAWLALRTSGAGFVLLTAALFLVKESEVNRSILAFFAALAALGLALARRGMQAWMRGERWARSALVVGAGEGARRLVAALSRYPEAGWVVRGCLSVGPADAGNAVPGVPVLGSLAELASVLQGDLVVDEVFFAVAPEQIEAIADALETCESLGVDTRVLVDLYRPAHAHAFVEEIFGLPFYGFSPTLTRQGWLLAKRAADILGAAALLALLAPLLALIAVAIKATSPGPALFRQRRAGFHGRVFWMYKFRTMVAGAEGMRAGLSHLNEMSGPVFKIADDPRLTWLGRLLRRSSLDELPQLINVLRGEMSLVGPRPLPVYEASRIKGPQRRRLAMRPGMTGLWQVSGRNQVDFDGWMQLDLAYVDRWSPGLDLRILLRTIPVVLRGEGAV
jgi:exopolysaccharide biosynthesis polyprenyl glycosylphosphotransferase